MSSTFDSNRLSNALTDAERSKPPKKRRLPVPFLESDSESEIEVFVVDDDEYDRSASPTITSTTASGEVEQHYLDVLAHARQEQQASQLSQANRSVTSPEVMAATQPTEIFQHHHHQQQQQHHHEKTIGVDPMLTTTSLSLSHDNIQKKRKVSVSPVDSLARTAMRRNSAIVPGSVEMDLASDKSTLLPTTDPTKVEKNNYESSSKVTAKKEISGATLKLSKVDGNQIKTTNSTTKEEARSKKKNNGKKADATLSAKEKKRQSTNNSQTVAKTSKKSMQNEPLPSNDQGIATKKSKTVHPNPQSLTFLEPNVAPNNDIHPPSQNQQPRHPTNMAMASTEVRTSKDTHVETKPLSSSESAAAHARKPVKSAQSNSSVADTKSAKTETAQPNSSAANVKVHESSNSTTGETISLAQNKSAENVTAELTNACMSAQTSSDPVKAKIAAKSSKKSAASGDAGIAPESVSKDAKRKNTSSTNKKASSTEVTSTACKAAPTNGNNAKPTKQSKIDLATGANDKEARRSSQSVSLPVSSNKTGGRHMPESKKGNSKSTAGGGAESRTSAPSLSKKNLTFQDQVLRHMLISCRPFSLKTLAKSLHTTETALNFLMLSLVDKHLVIKKEFASTNGASKELYWADQERTSREVASILQPVPAEERKAALEQLQSLQQKHATLARDLADCTNEPSNEDLSNQVRKEEEQIASLQQKVAEIRARIQAQQSGEGGKAPVAKKGFASFKNRNPTPSSPRRLKLRINNIRDAWKNRREKCNDFCEQLADGMEKKVKDVIKLLDLETDEMAKVTMPAKYAIESTRTTTKK